MSSHTMSLNIRPPLIWFLVSYQPPIAVTENVVTLKEEGWPNFLKTLEERGNPSSKNEALDEGSPMSPVGFKKWQCSM